MKFIRVIVFCFSLTFTFFAAPAGAVTDHGSWLCGDCDLSGVPGQPAEGDVHLFIAHTVNVSVHSWNPGDTVTICNGTVCSIYRRSFSQFFKNVPNFPDSQGPYQNHSGGTGGGGGGGIGGGWGGGPPGGSPGFGGHWVCGTASGGGGSSTTCVWVITMLP